MKHPNNTYACNTNKGLLLLLVFCILIPLVGFTQKFSLENNRKKPLIVTKKDTTFFFRTKEDEIIRLRENRFYYYYFHGNVLKTKGAYLGRLLHGEFVRLNGEGTLAEKGEFKNGLKQGCWKTWYKNGELKSEQVWINGKSTKFRFEYGLNGKREKFIFKKGNWVLKTKKEKTQKKKPVHFKMKFSLWKHKKGKVPVSDSIITKGIIFHRNKQKLKVLPDSIKATKRPVESIREIENKENQIVGKKQTTAGFLREHMAEYEQAKELESVKPKKKGSLKLSLKVKPKASGPQNNIYAKGKDVKVDKEKETPRRSNFFIRFWNKLKKKQP